jgi:hypothetical protein
MSSAIKLLRGRRECAVIDRTTGAALNGPLGPFVQADTYLWMEPDMPNVAWVQRSPPNIPSAAGENVITIMRLTEEEVAKYGPIPHWERRRGDGPYVPGKEGADLCECNVCRFRNGESIKDILGVNKR